MYCFLKFFLGGQVGCRLAAVRVRTLRVGFGPDGPWGVVHVPGPWFSRFVCEAYGRIGLSSFVLFASPPTSWCLPLAWPFLPHPPRGLGTFSWGPGEGCRDKGGNL